MSLYYLFPKKLIDDFLVDYPECEPYFSFFQTGKHNEGGEWIDVYWAENNAALQAWLKTDPAEDNDEVTFEDMFIYDGIPVGPPVKSGGVSGDWIQT